MSEQAENLKKLGCRYAGQTADGIEVWEIPDLDPSPNGWMHGLPICLGGDTEAKCVISDPLGVKMIFENHGMRSRCNQPCAHAEDVHDCDKCKNLVSFLCEPICEKCKKFGRQTCLCGTPMSEHLKAFLQEWEQKFPDLNCLTCFRMAKIRVERDGVESIYNNVCYESDKLRCIAPGFLKALRRIEGIKEYEW